MRTSRKKISTVVGATRDRTKSLPRERLKATVLTKLNTEKSLPIEEFAATTPVVMITNAEDTPREKRQRFATTEAARSGSVTSSSGSNREHLGSRKMNRTRMAKLLASKSGENLDAVPYHLRDRVAKRMMSKLEEQDEEKSGI